MARAPGNARAVRFLQAGYPLGVTARHFSAQQDPIKDARRLDTETVARFDISAQARTERVEIETWVAMNVT